MSLGSHKYFVMPLRPQDGMLEIFDDHLRSCVCQLFDSDLDCLARFLLSILTIPV